MDKNFLNNQNYILSKIEKKKLLSKFFIENSFLGLYFLLNKIKNRIDLIKVLFTIIISIFIIIPFLIYTNINPIFLFLTYILIIFIINIIFGKKDINLDIENISLKDFFYSKNVNFYTVVFIFGFILICFIFLYSRYAYYLTNSDYYLYGLYFIILLGIIYFNKMTVFILRFNILQLIILPLYIIYFIYKLVITSLYIFIIKGIKGFYFIKKTNKTSLLKKFNKLNRTYADNKYYKIKVKN